MAALGGGRRRKGKEKASSSVPASSPPVRRPSGIVIREPAPGVPTSSPVAASAARLSSSGGGDSLPPSKRARVDPSLLIPGAPHSSDFDPFVPLGFCLSSEAVKERDTYTRASTENERDPAAAAARLLLAAMLNLEASSASRRDVLSERDEARQIISAKSRELAATTDKLNAITGERDSLQTVLEENTAKHAETVEAMGSRIADLEAQLKKEREDFGMALMWRCSRFRYMSFRNAVEQLRIVNPGLVTAGICPTKVVANGVIRDPRQSDPDITFPPIPSDFGTKEYESDGDEEFPWFSDQDEEESGANDGAGGEPPAVETNDGDVGAEGLAPSTDTAGPSS